MSFLSALKGFGGWLAREWQKIYNAAPTIEKVADGVFSYAVPALQIILGMVAPEDALIVDPIIAEIQTDLHVASGIIYDFGANPTALSMVQTISGKLTDLLSAGHIKDAAVVAKVQLVVNTIGSLVTALENAIHPSA